ncbi:hypothetical protein NEAUS03_0546 [Nematocida ausubeli]|nr:hypothetical protein NEAUS03_0546 [Nematocida ausubeli]
MVNNCNNNNCNDKNNCNNTGAAGVSSTCPPGDCTKVCTNDPENQAVQGQEQMNYKMCLPKDISPSDVKVTEIKRGESGEVKIQYKKEKKVDEDSYKECSQEEGCVCFTINPNRRIKSVKIENSKIEVDLEEGEASDREIIPSLPEPAK